MILGKLLSKRKAVDPDPDVLRVVESSGLFDPVSVTATGRETPACFSIAFALSTSRAGGWMSRK